MTTLKNTNENRVFATILKTIKETDWCGNTVHNDIESCLVAINLGTKINGGFYKPTAITLKGINGYFMVNKDGSLLYDYRVIKTEKGYLIETLTSAGFNKFEKMYSELC